MTDPLEGIAKNKVIELNFVAAVTKKKWSFVIVNLNFTFAHVNILLLGFTYIYPLRFNIEQLKAGH